MAISFRKYVDIISGVGAGVVVNLRELMTRLFTTNPLLPTGGVREFTSATDVGNYFGTTSPEYLRALFYFGWISKNITKPSKISFARWADVAVAPRIYGAKAPHLLSTWQGVTDGAFVMTIGGTTNTMSGLNFSAAANLTNVATIITAAINAKTGAMWTAAAVTYNATRGSFDFVGGLTGDAEISVAANGTGTNILTNNFLGWTADGIFSNGSAAESPVDTVTGSTEASNNFGSFTFIPDLTDAEHKEVADWNATFNNTFMYLVPLVDIGDRSTLYAQLQGIPGVAVTYSPRPAEYPELVPGMIFAATDYDRPNAVQNYMFQQFNLTAAVTNDIDSDNLDVLRFNYYGATQTAGQSVEFYQRGLLQGGANDPSDMNVYANEIWLKDFIGSEIMTALLTQGRIPANVEGKGIIQACIQTGVDAAVTNGTVSPGKTLTNVQKLYVTQVTDDPDAWRQIENVGYVVSVRIEQEAIGDRIEYKAVYILVYSKDDAIRKVEGTHTLI